MSNKHYFEQKNYIAIAIVKIISDYLDLITAEILRINLQLDIYILLKCISLEVCKA